MLRSVLTGLMLTQIAIVCMAQTGPESDFPIPELSGFRALPAPEAALSAELAELVSATGLDTMTPAARNPDAEDEWASIAVVDLTSGEPVVGSWKGDNLIYPASLYKMYVLGEVIRQVGEGEVSLDDPVTIAGHNVREEAPLTSGTTVTVSEILRLMIQDSSNTAANEAIDLADRRRVTALLRALGCGESEITRKFLPRGKEDPGWADAPGTTSCANHLATFLWAAEQGAISGGAGRGLIKGYLAMCRTNFDRFRAGLPDSATVYAKTGAWDIFTGEAALVEDGEVKYILCAIVPQPREEAAPRMARLAEGVHALMRSRHASEGNSIQGTQ